MRILHSVWAFAIALGVSGLVQPVTAQEAKRLFFEGDIVSHALEGQAGPFCVLKNQYKRNEAVAWRIRVLDQTGAVADEKVLKSVVVILGNGQLIPTKYGPHPPRGEATDHFWSAFWTIPADFPTGSLGYKVIATWMDGTSQTWQPFTREPTQLTVVAGEPAMKSN
jgi:hypothetical protein